MRQFKLSRAPMSARHLLQLLLLAMAIVEVLVMLLLDALPAMLALAGVLLDAAVLLAVLYPLLYLLLAARSTELGQAHALIQTRET